MQWKDFACTSPPQSKILLRDNTNSRKSKTKNQHTLSSNKFIHHK
jgi:hypothetical protein